MAVLNMGGQADVRVLVDFEETKSNFSRARVDRLFEAVYMAPAGCTIASIQSIDGVSDPMASVSTHSYKDTDPTDDVYGPDHLVDQLVISADRAGLDVGYGTGVVSLSFQPVTVLLYCP